MSVYGCVYVVCWGYLSEVCVCVGGYVSGCMCGTLWSVCRLCLGM